MPTLRLGDVVIIDNLSARKRVGVQAVIKATGAQLQCLSPYNPGLDPIELAFTKLKHLLRSSGLRTVDSLWDLLCQAIDALDPTEYQNYLWHCGYTAGTANAEGADRLTGTLSHG